MKNKKIEITTYDVCSKCGRRFTSEGIKIFFCPSCGGYLIMGGFQFDICKQNENKKRSDSNGKHTHYKPTT